MFSSRNMRTVLPLTVYVTPVSIPYHVEEEIINHLSFNDWSEMSRITAFPRFKKQIRNTIRFITIVICSNRVSKQQFFLQSYQAQPPVSEVNRTTLWTNRVLAPVPHKLWHPIRGLV